MSMLAVAAMTNPKPCGSWHKSEVMRNRRRDKHYSAIRERLKREDAAHFAKLTPAARLQAALDLSDFCLMLAAKGREADAQRSFTKGRRGVR